MGIWGVLAGQALAQSQAVQTNATPTGRAVYVQQAPIRGRVFVAAERPGQEEQPARRVQLEIRTPDDSEILERVWSDDDGWFLMRELPTNHYVLRAGGMRLNLVVTPAGTNAVGQDKTIILVLPRKMLYLRIE